MIQLFTPNGKPITATREILFGSCGLAGLTRAPDGTLAIEYDGNGTQVDWDSQETVTRGGQRVFLDEDGGQWLENQLTARDIPDDPDTWPGGDLTGHPGFEKP